ncbi:acyl-CoA reductase [Anaerorhabdus sp.]|uniref:acyl-CoA reductase n=1 Tax=Anaerorhabdus sp. TaxID=1872524 RepID=UPI002B1F94CE|nr:acyl-CoA reductase [Anaerorhabdus sp.]MEA4874086.1 acyl-CoA reductase [Anaerorhabdus sp.]
MLLIEGEVLDNSFTQLAIKQMSETIPITLNDSQLTQDKIVNAIDQLITKFSRGEFTGELDQFDVSFNWDDIQTQLTCLTKKNIERRIKTELGQNEVKTSSGIKIKNYPLGVVFQLAAGNIDVLPVYSVLESLLVRNISILKLPAADKGITIFIIKKLLEIEPLITNYIYVFDTPSSDLNTILKLMDYANAIVVWGSDTAIRSVRENAPTNCRIIEWGHKLSFAYIQDLTIEDEDLIALATHIIKTKQMLCSSCQGIFIDTDDFDVVKKFASRFNQIIHSLEISQELNQSLQGKVTVELLTRKLETIECNQEIIENRFGSITCINDQRLELSLLNGNLWIKPMLKSQIIESLHSQHSYLQTVGIYPLSDELQDIFARAGLTTITSIATMSNFDFEEAHDGRLPLNEYCRKVNIKS